jgi:bifunctional UDP-N-acetylglucosamine pyrophosphorylase/glucosamine-1-phosphate N-acetyltransferase
VLEGNISLGSGAVLANLRLDDGDIYSMVKNERIATTRNKLGVLVGKHVRIGVNASIMPGIKIGMNSFIGSGVILDKDLPEQSYCIAKEAYTVTRNTITVEKSDRSSFKNKI